MNISSSQIRKIQFATLAVCGLAFLFWLFFDTSKHNPVLSPLNVFGEDPFDAVGSGGIQLAAFCVLAGLVRTFRPYPKGISADAVRLILRTDGLIVLTVIVTAGADLVALLRYLPVWSGAPAGWLLVGLLAVLLALTAGIAVFVLRLWRSVGPSTTPRRWPVTSAVRLGSALVLALYPNAWRQSVPGAVLTALVGMAILFIVCAALAKSIDPDPAAGEDLMDDLAAVYAGLKARLRLAGFFFGLLEKFFRLAWVRAAAQWLNPRRHAWRIVFLIAPLMGLALLALERSVEGPPAAGKVLLLVSVYIVIEGFGVLLGYLLLRRWLRIFRRE